MQKRVVIVDVNHLVHMHYHSRVRLSTRVKVDGEYIEKDTTILNGVLKSLFRWSKGGSYPLVVCFDRPVPARKAFFQTYFPPIFVQNKAEHMYPYALKLYFTLPPHSPYIILQP